MSGNNSDRNPVNVGCSAAAWDANRSDRSRAISMIRETTASEGSAANIFGRVGVSQTVAGRVMPTIVVASAGILVKRRT